MFWLLDLSALDLCLYPTLLDKRHWLFLTLFLLELWINHFGLLNFCDCVLDLCLVDKENNVIGTFQESEEDCVKVIPLCATCVCTCQWFGEIC